MENDSDDVILALAVYKRRKQRRRAKRMWVHPLFQAPRGLDYYRKLIMDLRNDENIFFEYFRMTTDIFDALVMAMQPLLQKNDTYMRDAITPEGQVAMALRFLASGDSFSSLALLFRKGKTTIKRALYDVCDAIWSCLQKQCLPEPIESTWRTIANRFHDRWQFPYCIGAIDGKHCVIQAPANTGSLCYNYKSTFSLVLLAIVDADYKFVLVDIGSNGSNSDSGIFQESAMGKRFESKTLNIPESEIIEGAEEFGALPYVLVGDEAFALNENMSRPYPGKGLSRTKRIFNYRLSRARRIVENAFGILAARWRFYNRRLSANRQNAIKIIKASVILHNLLQMLNQPVRHMDEPKQSILKPIDRPSKVSKATRNGLAVRDAFANLFSSTKGSIPWQDDKIDKGLY